jgi:hypothetical protein
MSLISKACAPDSIFGMDSESLRRFVDVVEPDRKKPGLSAADLVWLRHIRVGL